MTAPDILWVPWSGLPSDQRRWEDMVRIVPLSEEALAEVRRTGGICQTVDDLDWPAATIASGIDLWGELHVPDEHPARRGCLRALLAAALLVASLGCGAALGRHGHTIGTRFVQVDPPSAVVDIRPRTT